MEFNPIYQKYYQELYLFAIKQQCVDEVSDLLQDVFTKLYLEIQAGSGIENPRAWLYKVLINAIRSDYRTNKNRDLKKKEYALGMPDSAIMFEKLELQQRRDIVIKAIAGMEEKDRNILLLYHHQFSYKEISEILNISLSSVGTYVARSIEKLKSILKTNYHELFE